MFCMIFESIHENFREHVPENEAHKELSWAKKTPALFLWPLLMSWTSLKPDHTCSQKPTEQIYQLSVWKKVLRRKYFWCYSTFFLVTVNPVKRSKPALCFSLSAFRLPFAVCGTPKHIGSFWRHKTLEMVSNNFLKPLGTVVFCKCYLNKSKYWGLFSPAD